MTYVASKFRNKIDIGGHIIAGNYVEVQSVGQPVKQYVPDPNRVAGYKISIVPKPVWDAWYGANANNPMVTGNLIHGDDDLAKLRVWCSEHAKVVSGLQAGAVSPNGNGNK